MPGNPWVANKGVISSYPDTTCGVQIKAMGQEKDCGFWGCSWDTAHWWGWGAPTNAYEEHWVYLDCRADGHGINRYQAEEDAQLPVGVSCGCTIWATSATTPGGGGTPQYSC